MLNTHDYLLLGGTPGIWDGQQAGSNTDATRRHQYALGRRSAELVHGDSRHGFYVREAGVASARVMADVRARGGPLSGTWEDALVWGLQWAAADPSSREFYVSRNTLALHVRLSGSLTQDAPSAGVA